MLVEGEHSIEQKRFKLTPYSDAELVLSQVLQSFGGFVSITEFTAAQASVQHKHVAMALAFNLLITEIGGAIGSSIGTPTSPRAECAESL